MNEIGFDQARSDRPNRPRSRWRFSLGSLLLVVLVIALTLSNLLLYARLRQSLAHEQVLRAHASAALLQAQSQSALLQAQRAAAARTHQANGPTAPVSAGSSPDEGED